MELVDEAERAVAHAAALGLGQRRRSAAPSTRDLARGRRVEAAQQMQQRALARARSADDRDPLAAACTVEVDARSAPATSAGRWCRSWQGRCRPDTGRDVHS
mgnify:CR=1 FL=1